jgi:hypothetical protein
MLLIPAKNPDLSNASGLARRMLFKDAVRERQSNAGADRFWRKPTNHRGGL